MILLDTDILTLIQVGASPEYFQLVQRLDAANDSVGVTIISFEEQMRGWLALIARLRKPFDHIRVYERLHDLLDDFQTRPVVDFDERAALHFQHLVKTRIHIGTLDLRIAAIALAQDALLISRNLTDFNKVPGLRVEDWTRP